MPNANYKFLTPDEAGKILGVTRGQISIWIRCGYIKATNVGNGNLRPRWQINAEDLMGFHPPYRRKTKKVEVPMEKCNIKEPSRESMELTIRELLKENQQLRKELDKQKAKNKKLINDVLAVLAENE